jgi:hypothetical protein
LETAVELGAKRILAIDLSHCFEVPEPANAIEVLTRMVDIVMRDRVERDMALLERKARITLIQPEIEEGSGVGDLSQVSQLLERGEAFGERLLDQCYDKRGRLLPGTFRASVEVPAV